MVHQYRLGGYNIVLDACSGSVHVVDDLAYDVIGLLGQGRSRRDAAKYALEKYSPRPGVTREEVEGLLGEIDELARGGKLFSPDIYEDVSEIAKRGKPEIKALCMHVSHACNLTCEYCFAGEGRYRGERSLMSPEVGFRAIDFLIENSGSRRNLEVDFFGGEPLMNFDAVRHIVAYAREREKERQKRFRFTLTTNGVLLDDDIIDFLNREMHNVVLSLDGRREVHDRMRRTPDGKGSYDIVLPKFLRLVERRGGKGYYIRGTFTRENLDFAEDVIHMADLGFTELSMEPVVAEKGASYALTEEDLPAIFEQYERLAFEMAHRAKEGRGFEFYHFTIDLERGPCIHKRLSGCGVGTEYFAVTPSGELYPCHQFVGDPKFLMGDVYRGVTNAKKREEFLGCHLYSRPECKNCWARLYCAGGCAANAYRASGEIGGVYPLGCEMFKKRIECALFLKAAEAVPQDSR